MNKKILGVIVLLIIVGGGAFYGGVVYQKGQVPARGNFTGTFAGRTGTRTGGAGGVTAGQIISTSNGSVTVQLASGSTQIVLVGNSTQILKSVSGSPSDLTTGTNVVVMGTSNSDGSLTAQSVQVRPAGSTLPGQGGATTSGSTQTTTQ